MINLLDQELGVGKVVTAVSTEKNRPVRVLETSRSRVGLVALAQVCRVVDRLLARSKVMSAPTGLCT